MALALGAYTFLGGVVSLLGWVLDRPALADWTGGGVSIQPNAALCAAATGAALMLLQVQRPLAARALSALVALVGGATVLQHATGADLGIDRLLLFGREWGAAGTMAPGRMGVPSSLAWTLAGSGLVLASTAGARARRAAAALALAICAVAGLSLAGFLFGARELHRLPAFTTIALQTATFMFAGGVGLTLSVPEHGLAALYRRADAAGILVRRLMPPIVMLPVVLGWLRLRGEHLGLYDAAFGVAAFVVAVTSAFLMVLWSTTRVVARLEDAGRAEASARREQAARLSAKEAELTLVTEATPLALTRCSRELRYVFVNPAAAALLGRPPQEVAGRRIDEVLGERAFEQIRSHVEAVLRGERVEFEAQIVYPAGPRFVRESYVPERDGEGRVTGWIATIADLTERRQAEERLRESERAHRLLADISALAAGAGSDSSAGATRLVREVCARVATELQVPRCGFSRVDLETGRIAVEAEVSGELPPLAGSYALADYPEPLREDGLAGRTTAVCDLAADLRSGGHDAAHHQPFSVRGYVAVPLLREGRWVASFWVGSDEARSWRTAELELVEIVAARLWLLAEQARIATALLRSEARLSQELASTQRLQAIGARLVRGGDLQPLLTEILAASAEIVGTDKGNIQFIDARTGTLRIVAHQGLGERLVSHFAETGWQATCERASASVERVILEDVERAPGTAGTVDLEVVLADGIRAITSTPLVSRNGRLLGMLSNHFRVPHRPSPYELRFIDLLARMTADLIERQQAEDALREADRRKDEFLATLAHELRNPLAPIRNAAHILRARASAEPDVQWAHTVIDRQLRQLVRLVDDLLEVGRITRGTIGLRKQPVELAAVLAAAVESVRPLVDEARQGLVLDVPAEPVGLSGDGVRLTQVFANLLDNACKYTPAGGRIMVGVRQEPGFVEVSVRDTGAGIPRDKLEEVFEMFAQVDRPVERRQPGLGIGLHLVKRLVELHGGAVVARSEGEGRGSEFVVRLPLADGVVGSPRPADEPRPAKPGAEQVPARASTRGPASTPGLAATVSSPAAAAERTTMKERAIVSEPASASSAPPPPPSGRAQRVLVVDDNRDSVESLSLLLRLEGYETEVAYAGAEALSKASGFRPDVVLLDLGLPEMSGFDVCRALRLQPSPKPVRIIALTGWGQARDRERAREAGFDAHLVKPVDPAALIGLLVGKAGARGR